MDYPSVVRSVPCGAAVLLVDDDSRGRKAAGSLLRGLRIDVEEAETGAAAIAAIRARRFDLALIDLRLPDISGLDVIVALKKDRISVPWLLMSGWMTTPIAVEAMKLGAFDVVDMPFDIETVVVSALRDLTRPTDAAWPRIPPPASLPPPRSAAERWASFVVRGCAAEHDLKTIADWASVAGISYSALTECCRLVGIRPHDARDFLRMLRVLFHAHGRVKDLEHCLDVNDHRTLKALFERAGLALGRSAPPVTLREFIERQQFVDPACEAVRLMIKIVTRLDVAVPQPR